MKTLEMNEKKIVIEFEKDEALKVQQALTFLENLTDLIDMGFDLDKNSARDLIDAVNELKERS